MENAPKNTLSLVVITFNEEHNLPRCLQSINGLVDEIIVLDSGSTDQTKTLALAAGARFHEHPFAGHIQQKNHALSFVETSWVLSLDADEALEDTLREELKMHCVIPWQVLIP
ncbi:MAG: glycosyltransferase family 2 protein [Bacteroidota bacterium]